jgi:pyruvate dehydrogenase E1 component beta subunit
VTAEIAALIANRAFYYLDAPVERVGAMDVPIPFSPVLEDQTIPAPDTVVQTARRLLGR